MSDAPLSTRVTAPAVAAPASVVGLTWRRAVPDDIDALVELFRAVAAVDHPSYAATREEIADEFEHSYVDLEQDSFIGVDDATGAVVAYGLQILPPGQETLVRSIVDGAGVHPDHRGRGIGRALFAWQEQRGLQQLASSNKTLPGWIQAWADDRAPQSARLFARFGYPAMRWFIGVTRDLAEPIPAITPDDGIRIVPFSLEYSEATHAAKDAAFRDHWGSQPSTDEQWRSMLGMETFSFEHSFVALDRAGSVVGLLLTFVVEEDWPRQGYSGGYVALVGVVREARRKGVAPALLAANFRSLKAAGLERCDLDVDSDNPTGALGLYTGMGFVENSRSANYVKVF